MENVNWKPIKGYEGIYEIGDNGLFHNLRKDKYTFGSIKNNKHRPQITLSKNKEQTVKCVHILIWETFVGSIPKGYEIHHINGNRQDNRLENLQCLTKEEHKELHKKNRVKKEKIKKTDMRKKTIIQYTLDGEFVAEYQSISEAAKKNGLCESNICSCCKQKEIPNGKGGIQRYKSVGGYIWKYKEVA